MKTKVKVIFIIIIIILVIINLFYAIRRSLDNKSDVENYLSIKDSEYNFNENIIETEDSTEFTLVIDDNNESVLVKIPKETIVETEETFNDSESYISQYEILEDISEIEDIYLPNLSKYKKAVNIITTFLGMENTVFLINYYTSEDNPFRREGFDFVSNDLEIFIKKEDTCVNIIKYNGQQKEIYDKGYDLFNILNKDQYSFMSTYDGFEIENYAF